MKNIIILILSFCLCSCAYLYPTKETRIAEYKERCELIGYTTNSNEITKCVLELEKAYEQGRAQRSSSSSSGMSFLCKDALSRGDSGAINTHCN